MVLRMSTHPAVALLTLRPQQVTIIIAIICALR